MFQNTKILLTEKIRIISKRMIIAMEAWAAMTALLCDMSISSAVSQQGQTVSIWGRLTDMYSQDSAKMFLVWVILLSFFYVWKKEQEKTFSIPVAGVSLLFGFGFLIGKSFLLYENFSLLLKDSFQFVFMLFVMLGYAVIFYYIICALFHYMEKHPIVRYYGETDTETQEKKYGRKTVLLYLFLMLCYLPYLIAFYPGSINSDTLHQMCSYFGYVEWTNHYPVFSTWLIGSCMYLGRLFHSDNLGAFFYGVLQTAALAAAFANTLRVMKKWGISRRVRGIILVFYAITPFFGGYAQFLIKDTLYSAAVLIFVTIFFEILFCENTFIQKKRYHIQFVIGGILVALLRNNGIYVVIPVAVILVAALPSKKGKGKAACMLVGIWLFYYIWMHLVLSVLGIPNGSIKEALSIPFQQTARYVKEYGDEVTVSEEEAINAVLDYDSLADLYTTYGSDPVKNTYKEPAKGESSKLGAYFKVWFLMFLKHPGVYFEATISNSYYYYCANINTTLEPVFLEDITQNEQSVYFSFAQLPQNEKFRDAISAISNLIQKTPVVGEIYSEGCYTYLLFIMAAFCFYKKRYRKLAALVPAFFCLLICIASPINGSFRYFLPIIVLTPISWTFIFHEKSRKQ